MRTVFITAVALVALACGAADATPLKPDQVRTVCGKKLQETSKAMGCERECGTKTCAYSCSKDKKGNAKDCFGDVLAMGEGSGGPKPRGKAGEASIPAVGGSILDSGPGLGTQGPAGTGSPVGGGKSAPPPAKIY